MVSFKFLIDIGWAQQRSRQATSRSIWHGTNTSRKIISNNKNIFTQVDRLKTS
jgi:hypothetical protein